MENIHETPYSYSNKNINFYDKKFGKIWWLLDNAEIDIVKELSELVSKDYDGLYSKCFERNKKHLNKKLFKDNEDDLVKLFEDTIKQIHQLKRRVGFGPLYKLDKFIFYK